MRGSKRDTDVLSSLLDSVGEGEGGMIWENGIERCKLSYVKNFQSRFDALIQVAQGWCTGMQLGSQPRGMGWGGRWEGGSGWGTHVHP